MQKTAMENSVLGQLGLLIDEINAHETKQASAKKQAAVDGSGSGGYKTDPGSKGGPSTHPSAKLDGNNHPASYGAHGKETSEDVKSDIPNSPDSTSDSVNKQDSDYDHVQIGVRVSATGEDPSVENAYKGHKDDPGTSSPAKADGGEKYSSVSFPNLYKQACAKIEDVLTRLIADGGEVPQATKEAAAAGYALADIAAASPTTDMQQVKLAAAQELVASTLKEAYADADLVGEFLYKLAAEEQAQLPPEMGGGAPPPDGGGAGGAGGMMPPDMGAMGAPPGAGGGMPPEMGGAPPGAGGSEGGEGGGSDEAINEMANALIDAGIPAEKLIAALEGAAQGGGGGGEPAAPGGEKAGSAKTRMDRSEMEVLYKAAHNVVNLMDNGRFRRTRPLANSKQAQDRNEMLSYLNDYVREALSMR